MPTQKCIPFCPVTFAGRFPDAIPYRRSVPVCARMWLVTGNVQMLTGAPAPGRRERGSEGRSALLHCCLFVFRKHR